MQESQGKTIIVYHQKKTQELNYLPIPEQALEYLGERGEDKEKIFNLFGYDSVNKYLRA